MEPKAKKAISVMTLGAVLPIAFSMGLTQYPLATIGAVCVGIIGVNEWFGEQDPDVVPRNRFIESEEVRSAAERTFLSDFKDRARFYGVPL